MRGKIKQTGARSSIKIQDLAKNLEETPPHDSLFLKLELIFKSNPNLYSNSRLRLKVSQKRGRVTDVFIQ